MATSRQVTAAVPLGDVLRGKAHELLAFLALHRIKGKRASMTIWDDTWTARLTVEPATRPLQTFPESLSRIEKRVLEKATVLPIPAKKLARRAGYRNGSYFRGAVARLCRLHLLTRTPDGLARTVG